MNPLPEFETFPTSAEIEAMRGGGFVPDTIVDALHRERARHDAAHRLLDDIAARDVSETFITIPTIGRESLAASLEEEDVLARRIAATYFGGDS